MSDKAINLVQLSLHFAILEFQVTSEYIYYYISYIVIEM